MRPDAQSSLVRPSPRLLALFELYLRWYTRRNFHGFRVAHGERFPKRVDGPLIVYLNHASWWDPLTCIMLSRRFLAGADHYAPMDEAALERYRFFGKLGLFPVEMETTRGAIQFLRYSRQVLAEPNSVLWLTPEGHFTDARLRPPVFKDGLATLLARTSSATLVPIAIEYIFWDERNPEILVSCGNPIHTSDSYQFTAAEWNAALGTAMAATQDDLAQLAMSRDPAQFESLLAGGAGVGICYDLWQRLRSALRGEAYLPGHGSIHRP
jgi:1-acyl-sn-glycerol-3-phosphate acyltransferase